MPGADLDQRCVVEDQYLFAPKPEEGADAREAVQRLIYDGLAVHAPFRGAVVASVRNFDKLAGSASSLYTTLMFALGAVLSGISGLLFNGTLKPMAFVMIVASAAATLLGSGLKPEPARL